MKHTTKHVSMHSKAQNDTGQNCKKIKIMLKHHNQMINDTETEHCLKRFSIDKNVLVKCNSDYIYRSHSV